MLLDPRGLWHCLSGPGKAFVLHFGSNTGHPQSRSEQNEKKAQRAYLRHPLSWGLTYLFWSLVSFTLHSKTGVVGVIIPLGGGEVSLREDTQLGTSSRGIRGDSPRPLPRYSRAGTAGARGHCCTLRTCHLFFGQTIDGTAASELLPRQDRLGASGPLLRAAREGVGTVPHPH